MGRKRQLAFLSVSDVNNVPNELARDKDKGLARDAVRWEGPECGREAAQTS